jgi:predicted dehydrogenase
VRHALQVIESGERGELISMRGVYGKSQIISFDSDWRTKRELSGGGILLDQGIHMVDMMRLFAASEFTDVHSYVSNDFWKHDVEDNAYALMRADNGVVAMLHSSATQWRHRFSLELTLTKGAILLGGLLTSTKSYGAETITIVKPGGAPGADAGDPPEESHRYNFDGSWRDEIAEFADTVVNDREVAHGTSLDALRTVQTVYRIYCADENWARQYDLSCEVPVRDA